MIKVQCIILPMKGIQHFLMHLIGFCLFSFSVFPPFTHTHAVFFTQMGLYETQGIEWKIVYVFAFFDV